MSVFICSLFVIIPFSSLPLVLRNWSLFLFPSLSFLPLPSLSAERFLLHVYSIPFLHILLKFPEPPTHLHYFVIEPIFSPKYVVLTV